MKRGSRKNRLLDLYLGVPVLTALTAAHRRRRYPESIERVGIMVNPALGDTLLSSGPVRDLRQAFPSQRLIFFCVPSNRIAAELLPGVDEIIVVRFTRPHEVVAQLRAARLDVLFDFTSWQRITALCTYLSGARYTVGFRAQGQHRHRGYDCVAEHRRDRHEIDNLRTLARAAGVSTGLAPDLVLPVKPEFQMNTNAEEVVVFHAWPSGAQSWLREWPTQCWVELAQLLAAPGRAFVLTASKEDRPRALELCAAMQAMDLPTEVFTGKDGLVSVAYLLRQARLLVSVNTGIMHLGAILGTPTVVINGPTAEHRWGPVGTTVANVNAADGSGGFLHFGFEFDGHPTDTMERISVREVLAAAKQLMGELQEPAGERA